MDRVAGTDRKVASSTYQPAKSEGDFWGEGVDGLTAVASKGGGNKTDFVVF